MKLYRLSAARFIPQESIFLCDIISSMKKISKHINIVLAVFAVVVVFAAYMLYQNYTLSNQNKSLTKELSSKVLELNNATSTILSLKNNFSEVEKEKIN